jgi:transposase-like protein
MSSRRKFSDEYKPEAERPATQPGVTKSQVAGDLGINANLLAR